MMPFLSDKVVLINLKKFSLICNMSVVIVSSIHNYKNIMELVDLDAYAFFEKPLNGEIFNDFITHWHLFKRK